MSRYHLTTDANEDLEAITDYYADKNPEAGQQLIRTIRNGCRLRAGQSRTGIAREDISPGVRCFVAYPYLVFFRPSPMESKSYASCTAPGTSAPNCSPESPPSPSPLRPPPLPVSEPRRRPRLSFSGDMP